MAGGRPAERRETRGNFALFGYAAYRIARGNFAKAQKTWPTFAPYTAVIATLGAINVVLFVLPMAMRM